MPKRHRHRQSKPTVTVDPKPAAPPFVEVCKRHPDGVRDEPCSRCNRIEKRARLAAAGFMYRCPKHPDGNSEAPCHGCARARRYRLAFEAHRG